MKIKDKKNVPDGSKQEVIAVVKSVGEVTAINANWSKVNLIVEDGSTYQMKGEKVGFLSKSSEPMPTFVAGKTYKFEVQVKGYTNARGTLCRSIDSFKCEPFDGGNIDAPTDALVEEPEHIPETKPLAESIAAVVNKPAPENRVVLPSNDMTKADWKSKDVAITLTAIAKSSMEGRPDLADALECYRAFKKVVLKDAYGIECTVEEDKVPF